MHVRSLRACRARRFKQETGREAPIQESVPRDVAGVVADVDVANVKLDDEASRDVSSGVPIDTIRKYVGQIQALRDELVSTRRELADAKASAVSLDFDDDDADAFVDGADWLSGHHHQPDTSATLGDIMHRLSFGSHNSPLVKLARANLIKRRSPAGKTTTARIIAETKQASADVGDFDDSEVAQATGEALAEVEVQFEKKHGEMVKTMQSLSDDIKVRRVVLLLLLLLGCRTVSERACVHSHR